MGLASETVMINVNDNSAAKYVFLTQPSDIFIT